MQLRPLLAESRLIAALESEHLNVRYVVSCTTSDHYSQTTLLCVDDLVVGTLVLCSPWFHRTIDTGA